MLPAVELLLPVYFGFGLLLSIYTGNIIGKQQRPVIKSDPKDAFSNTLGMVAVTSEHLEKNSFSVQVLLFPCV